MNVAKKSPIVENTSAIAQMQATVMTAVERVGFCVGCKTVGRREIANTICTESITQSCHMREIIPTFSAI